MMANYRRAEEGSGFHKVGTAEDHFIMCLEGAGMESGPYKVWKWMGPLFLR